MKINIFLFPFCMFALSHLFGQSTVTRNLSSFEKIDVAGGYDKVILKEGSTESVSLDVSGTDPENILTDVDNNTLHIHMKKGNYNHMKATLTVTYHTLKAVNNSGSTNITTDGAIKGGKFALASSGSGNFNGRLDVDKLDIAISGSSNMILEGRADEQRIAISGSGDVKAHTLKGKQADVAISGSGDVALGVNGPVHSHVSGSGKVTND
jgi:hypothetical protein